MMSSMTGALDYKKSLYQQKKQRSGSCVAEDVGTSSASRKNNSFLFYPEVATPWAFGMQSQTIAAGEVDSRSNSKELGGSLFTSNMMQAAAVSGGTSVSHAMNSARQTYNTSVNMTTPTDCDDQDVVHTADRHDEHPLPSDASKRMTAQQSGLLQGVVHTNSSNNSKAAAASMSSRTSGQQSKFLDIDGTRIQGRSTRRKLNMSSSASNLSSRSHMHCKGITY